MMILLGDVVTVTREIGDDLVIITGRVNGLVQGNHGELKQFYIKGVDLPLWMSDGWSFSEEEESDEDA